MPNDAGTQWVTYVCSGTLVQLPSTSVTPDRSLVLTAAHCIYDSKWKVFAQSALFIPQQDDGGTDLSDRVCTNDALGCIALHYGVVSDEWAIRQTPFNNGVDYGFYISKSTTTSKGNTIGPKGSILPMVADFGPTTQGKGTYAMGYSLVDGPKFTYTYDFMSPIMGGTAQVIENYLASSKLTGGSSGGPWTQDNPSSGVVNIIGVNSWGPTTGSGMAAAPLNTGGATCLYDLASYKHLSSIAGYGEFTDCSQ